MSDTQPPPPPNPSVDLLDLVEALLESQLKAVRALRKQSANPPEPAPVHGMASPRKGRSSQISVVVDILKAASTPLHINEILARAKAQGFNFDRESLVSALTKRVQRADRFARPAPNTFALLP